MAKSSPTFRPKDRIDHFKFGLGVIVEVNDAYTTIAFDEEGTRKFVNTILKLNHSDAPAPAKPARKKAASKKATAKKATAKKATAKKATAKKATAKKATAKKATTKKATTKKAAAKKTKTSKK